MRLEHAEAEAFADLYEGTSPATAAALGAGSARIGDVVCGVVHSVSSAIFNRVMGLGLTAPATERQLDEVADFYGATEYFVALSPDARPVELPRWLAERGFERADAWAKFSRSTADPPAFQTSLRVQEVGANSAEDWRAVMLASYGMPSELGDFVGTPVGRAGWTCFVAYEGDLPVASAALLASNRVGWLGMAGTRPEHRRKGAQSALLSARIARAAELGCEIVTTETGEPFEGRPSDSHRNIERSGFELRYLRPNYRSPT